MFLRYTWRGHVRAWWCCKLTRRPPSRQLRQHAVAKNDHYFESEAIIDKFVNKATKYKYEFIVHKLKKGPRNIEN